MPKKEYEYKGFKMNRVEVEDEEEHWNKYTLEDGTVIRVKVVLTQAGKSVDKPIPESGGEPLYHVRTDTVVDTIVPDDQYMEVEEGGEDGDS